jgi:hypothetical protein
VGDCPAIPAAAVARRRRQARANRVRGQAPQFGALRWRRNAPKTILLATMGAARLWAIVPRRSGGPTARRASCVAILRCPRTPLAVEQEHLATRPVPTANCEYSVTLG